MVYKRWIKRDGKKIGPYYYKSVRKNGSIKSVYLGNKYEEQENHQNHLLRGIFHGFLIGLMCLILIIAAGSVQRFLSGFIFHEQIKSQEVNISANSSGEYDIILEDVPENFNITSFKISGIINGNARVYLKTQSETLLVYKSEEKGITGFALEEVNSSSNESTTPPNEEQVPLENITNETIVNETLELNEAEKTGVELTGEQAPDHMYSFNEVCSESCSMNEKYSGKIKLIIELDGYVEIRKIDYSLSEQIYGEVDDEVLEAIKEDGSAKVIVEIKEDSRGIQNIESKQDAVVSATNPDDFEVEHKYEDISAISGEINSEGLSELMKNKNVDSIKIDRVLRILLDGSVPLINATKTWAVQINGENITGTGQAVCMLDTGVNRNHPALAGKIIAEQCYCSVSGPCCPNHEINDSSADDDNSHGTHVAGIVASTDAVYRGVAPDSKIVAVKVCDASGSCAESNIIAGIAYCTENSELYNISVISMSLGLGYSGECNDFSNSMTTAINNAVSKGIVVTIASGNGGYNDKIYWPACVENATAVGATDDSDNIGSYSNRNSIVSLVAPGSDITSSCPTGFCSKTGTSMATPHVAGAVLLLKQYYKMNGITPNVQDIIDILKSTGKPVYDSSNGLTFYRINIFEAINSIYRINETEKSIEKPGNAKIIFNETVDLSKAADAFKINYNSVELDSERYPELNKSAYIILSNLEFNAMPVVLKNGEVCADCLPLYYNNKNFVFYVPHFTTYSAGANSLLEAWNTNGKLDENITFYANYTDRNSGNPINESLCRINFSDYDADMQPVDGLFEYSRTFSEYWNSTYTINCSSAGFEPQVSRKNITVGKASPEISLNLNGKSANITVRNNSQVEVNALLISPENESIDLWIDNALVSQGNNISINYSIDREGLINITASFDETESRSAYSKTLWVNSVEDYIPPLYSNIENPARLNYTLNHTYQFNITWQDNNTVDSVIIEHNFSGVMKNYSVNRSGEEYYYNWKDMKAGNYSFRWIANDSLNNINMTELSSYTVNKQQSKIKLEINGAEGNVSLKRSYAEIRATLIIPTSGTVIIKKNNEVLTTGISALEKEISFSSGTYTINASYAGNENYTPASTWSILKINLSSLLDEESAAGAAPEIEPVITALPAPIPGCNASWQCSPWMECINGQQARVCLDLNKCGVTTGKPAESQACSQACNENWNCTEWTECYNKTQTRNCSDLNNCKPAKTEGQECKKLPLFAALGEKVNEFSAKIVLTAKASLNFAKKKPIYLVLGVSGILIILLAIKFRQPAIRFIKTFRIVRVKNE